MNNPHKAVFTAWLGRVHIWISSERGNTQRLARALNIDRRRLSQWMSRDHLSVPGWAVAPLARLTGEPIHMDHLPVLPAVTPPEALAGRAAAIRRQPRTKKGT